MHANLLAQSDNISGEELRGRGVVKWTIAGMTVEELEKMGKPGQKTKRGRITFSEVGSKPWIINVTNKKILIDVFGGGRCGKQGSPAEHRDGKCYQTDHWIGHWLALGPTEQRAGGERVDGIIVVGCGALTAPLTVEIALAGKGRKSYTVNPPSKGAPPNHSMLDPAAHPPAGS